MTHKTILVVEDNPTMAEGICDALEMEGYATIRTSNGVEALARLEENHVDLILADIMMPLMDGYDFYRKVRECPEWMAIPFVFLTAKAQKEDVRLGKRLGADDYLTKPFDADELSVVVEAKLRRAEEVRQAADRQLDELKYTILNALSHEFRTPLTYIQGYTDLLIDSDPAAEPQIFKDFLRRIQLGSQRIQGLVEDFIFLVSMESGEVAHAIAEGALETDLMPTLRATTSAYRENLTKKNITLHTDWASVLPHVLAYGPLIADAFGRLLDNAIKFAPSEGAEISIRAKEVAGQVRISIRDNGIGIPAEEHARIFDRFYQVNRDLYEQQGVGLGLSIAQSIVELHQGTIKVESALGEGSTFTIVLPVAQ
jgi:two-component system sensor histidine kinase/response regulator